MTACVTTQLPVEEGGGAGKVAYIDTEGTFRCAATHEVDFEAGLKTPARSQAFLIPLQRTHQSLLLCRPDRLRPIATRLGMDPDAIAENVRPAHW
jgi:RecA/RadA recombinase